MAKQITSKGGHVVVSTPAGKMRIPTGVTYNVIPTHYRPHHDEMVAIYLLLTYGERLFPGISNAAIDYFPTLHLPEGYNSVQELLAAGIVPPVGMLQTAIDEHPLNEELHAIASHRDGDPDGHAEECAASLVAKLLDIHERPELQRLLAFVRRTDLKAAAHPFDISALVKAAHWKDHSETGQERTIQDVFYATEAFIAYENVRVAAVPDAYAVYLRQPRKQQKTEEEFGQHFEGELDARMIAEFFDCVMHAWIGHRFFNQPKLELEQVDYFAQYMTQLRKVKRPTAKKLEPIYQDPAMQYIVGYWRKLAVNNVRQGLAAIAATMLWRFTVNPEIAIEFAFKYLDVMYDRQHHFLNETAAEFREKAKVEQVEVTPGVAITLVSVESDDELMGTYARSDLGANADVVIQRMPKTGHVAITTNTVKKHKRKEMADVTIRMDDIAAVMRFHEQRCKKGPVVVDRFSDLLRDGTLDEVPEWFFFRRAMAIFNGSLTAPTVPPTKIPFNKIVFMVKKALNQSFFVNKFKTTCVKGVCKASQANPCPIYGWGLWRCRNIRGIRHEANKRQNDAPPQLVQITVKTPEKVEA